MQKKLDPDKVMLMVAFARIDVSAFAVAFGTLFSIALFLATIILVNKGGEHIGPNLANLGTYLPGYTVSALGSVIGAVYFFIIGAVIGGTFAALWNLTHYIFIVLSVLRTRWWEMMAD